MTRQAMQPPLPFMPAQEPAELQGQFQESIVDWQNPASLLEAELGMLRNRLKTLAVDFLEVERERRQLKHRNAELQAKVSLLSTMDMAIQFHVGPLRQAEMRKQLLDLIAIAHPDKWGNHPCAEEITKGLVALRNALGTKKGKTQ